MFANINYK